MSAPRRRTAARGPPLGRTIAPILWSWSQPRQGGGGGLSRITRCGYRDRIDGSGATPIVTATTFRAPVSGPTGGVMPNRTNPAMDDARASVRAAEHHLG